MWNDNMNLIVSVDQSTLIDTTTINSTTINVDMTNWVLVESPNEEYRSSERIRKVLDNWILLEEASKHNDVIMTKLNELLVMARLYVE